MNRSDAELDTIELDELHWALLRRMNGHLTLDEVFRATKIPAIDALKIAGLAPARRRHPRPGSHARVDAKNGRSRLPCRSPGPPVFVA